MSTNILANRCVEGDWWAHPIPENVEWGEGLYIETAQIFRFTRGEKNPCIAFGNHVSCYAGCSFSVGKRGYVRVGDFTLLNGALLMAEERIEIGSHCLLSWSVGIADSDFHPIDPVRRKIDAEALAPFFEGRPPRPEIETKPVIIADNVWIGMNATVLKGVKIGENSIVAAGSVVTKSVPPNVVVAGNPATVIKHL